MNGNAYLGISIFLGAAAALLYVSSAQASDEQPTAGDSDVSGRGFRNNNPLNLRYVAPPHNFNGQTGQDSGGYGIYDTTANGVRAAGLQLTIDYNAGLQTIAALIAGKTGVHAGWAPANENNVPAYIADVSTRTGIPSDQILSWPGDQIDVMAAMIWHEEGSNPFTEQQLQVWVNS